MIGITNMGRVEGEAPDSDLRWYSVQVNISFLVDFKHNRGDGLAVCLEKAAKAVREGEDNGWQDA